MSFRRTDWMLFGLVLALGLTPWLGSPYVLRLGTFACLYAVLAMSWNVIGGMTGYPSFATAAFFGLGAYVGGILLTRGYPLIVAMGAAALVAFVGAMVLGGLAATARTLLRRCQPRGCRSAARTHQ